MSTERISVAQSDGWVKVADAVEDFLLENISSTVVHVHFGTSPITSSAFHSVRAREGLVRVASGDLYIRASTSDSSAHVVISK